MIKGILILSMFFVGCSGYNHENRIRKLEKNIHFLLEINIKQNESIDNLLETQKTSKRIDEELLEGIKTNREAIRFLMEQCGK